MSYEIKLSRISKLLVDRDATSIERALSLRQDYGVSLFCGDDVASSRTLQLAVLTAAGIASRCFPGAVHAALGVKLREAPLLLWPWLKLRFIDALADVIGAHAITELAHAGQVERGLVFGDAPEIQGALRVTFDGWVAKVGPVRQVPRLAEREYCTLAGVLAASLGMSELFLSFAEIAIEAARRPVGLSLWRPDLDIADPRALGISVEYLPAALWTLGLGHLGNAYIWSLATLPYPKPERLQVFLTDFDKVEPENVETGLLFNGTDIGRYKTRACSGWLEQRWFETRMVERRFDAQFRVRADEPQLALCGFDTNPARRDLPHAGFRRVIESGLGGMAANFDTISLHTLPNPRLPQELWPDLSPEQEAQRKADRERAARDNPGYLGLSDDECGRYDLAGKAVAVPFVGAAAATLVIAETLRMLHDGPAYTDIKLGLGALATRSPRPAGIYSASDTVGLAFSDLSRD